jgi:STE24 endopeptidase
MHWLTVLFLVALAGMLATRLWLSSRQIAAVRAHRDQVPEPFRDRIALADQQKAADYTVARARLGRLMTVFEAALLLLFTLLGGIAVVDALWLRLGIPQPWHGTLVVLSVLALMNLIRLPFAVWRIFGLETRFGFNRTTPALFVADLAKHALLSLVIGTPLLLGVLLLMERAGGWWWLVAWVGGVIVTFALTWAWPRFIAPLFNRFTPLKDEALKARVERLLDRCGFASKGLFVMDGSRRSGHGNAYFTGVGRNKRIVFFDTLVEKLDPAEVEAVLAHELGHFRLQHVRQRLVVSAVAALIGLALLAWLAGNPSSIAALGVPRASAHAALLLFMLVIPVFTFFTTPIGALWSRRHEFEADEFAARYADARSLADALVKLYRDNASTLTPDRIHSAFYDSHPPALVRIARLTRLSLHPQAR